MLNHRPPNALATILPSPLDTDPAPGLAGHLLAGDAADVHDLGIPEAAGGSVGGDWDDDVCEPRGADLGDE